MHEIDWVKQVLCNDEHSTDAELVEYFVSEGMELKTAKSYVVRRYNYLNKLTF